MTKGIQMESQLGRRPGAVRRHALTTLAAFAAFAALLIGGLGALIGPAAAQTTSESPAASAETAPAGPGAGFTLRVGTEGNYAPYSFRDADSGTLTGYDVDVITAVANKLGWNVEFTEAPWDSLFSALDSGRVDVVANQVSVTPERQAKYSFSDVYYRADGSIVTAAGAEGFSGLGSLKGKTAAQTSTSNWADVAREAGANVSVVESWDQTIEMLSQGRVDFTINDSGAVAFYLKTTGNTSVQDSGAVGQESEVAFPSRADSPLTAPINQALDELRADGTLAQIGDKYFGADAQVQAKPSVWRLISSNLWPLLKSLVLTTIPLTAISFVVGLVIALGIALARLSTNRVLSGLARAYISVIRGTPLLVQLFIVFFGLPQFGLTIASFPAAAIALSLNVGGYAAEIIRSAILSVPKGQWEAARVIGMDYRTSLRRIILPQALRTAVPPLSNTLISLVKDTSLASTIVVTELLYTAKLAAAPSFDYFTMYLVAAVYYWVVCVALSGGQARLEKRLERYVT